MPVEYRDLLERAEKMLTEEVGIEEVALVQETIYLSAAEIRLYDEDAGNLLGVLAYRLRSRMRQLCPDNWLSYLKDR